MWKVSLTIALVIFLFALGLVGGVAAFVINGLAPMGEGEERRVEIEEGMTSSEIARLLEEQGVIRNAQVFKYYLRFKGEGHRFQAGAYLLRPGMELDDLIAKFNKGDVIPPEMIRFTVPEGWTVEQIAAELAAKGYVDEGTFLELANRPEEFAGTRAEGIPDDSRIRHRLEGYLFPETYALPAESDEKELIRRMLAELDRKLGQLPEGWEQRMEELGIDFHQLMTIASLIEREVVVDKERPLVAGVIYNRLKSGMNLEIDATVQYALGEQKERLLYEDLEVDSPYNTYANAGIPPGPIASPGIRSIEAALYPEESSYLFYVTKKDGTQEHYFAETFAQHQANIRKSNENQRKSGGASQ